MQFQRRDRVRGSGGGIPSGKSGVGTRRASSPTDSGISTRNEAAMTGLRGLHVVIPLALQYTQRILSRVSQIRPVCGVKCLLGKRRIQTDLSCPVRALLVADPFSRKKAWRDPQSAVRCPPPSRLHAFTSHLRPAPKDIQLHGMTAVLAHSTRLMS